MESVRKHSKKRDAILTCIRGTASHPTAEWVYTALKPEIPDLSLATVYRNLALFRAGGEIQSVGVHGGLEHFDGNTAPHTHFCCERCGAVSDLEDIPVPDFALRDVKVTGVELMLHGVCKTCLESEKQL